MFDARAQQIAAMFKPVNGGYVFRLTFPFALRGAPCFLVTEEQKAWLLDRLLPKRPGLWACGFVGAILGPVMAATATVWALSPHANPAATDTAAMLALSAVLLAIEFLVFSRRQQRRIAPLLRELTPTDLPFTLREAREASLRALPTRQLAIVLGCSAFTAFLQVMSAIPSLVNGRSPGYLQLGSALIFVGLTIYWGRHLRARLNAESTSGLID